MYFQLERLGKGCSFWHLDLSLPFEGHQCQFTLNLRWQPMPHHFIPVLQTLDYLRVQPFGTRNPPKIHHLNYCTRASQHVREWLAYTTPSYCSCHPSVLQIDSLKTEVYGNFESATCGEAPTPAPAQNDSGGLPHTAALPSSVTPAHAQQHQPYHQQQQQLHLHSSWSVSAHTPKPSYHQSPCTRAPSPLIDRKSVV